MSLYDASAALLLPRPLRSQVPQWLTSWIVGSTPLSTVAGVTATITGYLALIFGLQARMRSRPAFGREPWFKAAFLAHNVALAAGSALLLAVMLEEILPMWARTGFFNSICAKPSWTPHMETFYIINYYFKYWELVDTIFLVLKKKPLQFLHVYHHSATAVLCLTQLYAHTPVSWVVICLNLAVHVLMYTYYALTSLGIKCPWKRWVTTSQIVQFVLDLGVVYFATYSHFSNTYAPWLPHIGGCAGEEYAAAAGCATLTSYLFLFIHFYRKTYKKPAGKIAANGHAANGSGKSNGHAGKHQ